MIKSLRFSMINKYIIYFVPLKACQYRNKFTLPIVSFTSLENKEDKLDWVTDLSLIRKRTDEEEKSFVMSTIILRLTHTYEADIEVAIDNK